MTSIKKNDLYTYVHNMSITINGTTYGQIITQYEVRAYKDVRNLTESNGYLVKCTQRLIVPNQTVYNVPQSQKTGYQFYPAILTSKISIDSPPDDMQLVDYSPRTLNTAIISSANSGTGNTATQTQQHTTGSSTSQTNSYGASVSAGFFGDVPTFGESYNEEHAKTKTTENSDSLAHGVGHSSQHSSGTSMSIKDWGCYAQIDKNLFPSWIWGQEYPWNIIQLNAVSNNYELPQYVQNRLYNKEDHIVYPPSELSLFGVDFVSKASWIVYQHGNQLMELIFNHTFDYYQASHQINDNILNVSITKVGDITKPTGKLNLGLLALDPIMISDSEKNAIVGFIPNNFIVLPSTAPFIINSITNNLIVEDKTDYATSYGDNIPFTVDEDGLVASFAQFEHTLKLTASFKVADLVNNYTLHMKHWLTNNTDVKLTLTFNGDVNNQITKYVTASEAEGGEENLLSISLRDLNYASVNYHDYLKIGLNSIDITIEPVDKQFTNCEYKIRAMSIEVD